MTASVKFVYCHKCKELRVKPWYSMRARCARCRADAREISVPRTTLSFVTYGLIAEVLGTVFIYTRTDESIYLYAGIVGLVATFVVQAIEISRGERVARSRIRATKSDAVAFRKRGWL